MNGALLMFALFLLVGVANLMFDDQPTSSTSTTWTTTTTARPYQTPATTARPRITYIAPAPPPKTYAPPPPVYVNPDVDVPDVDLPSPYCIRHPIRCAFH
ncbi:hypothetical protein AXA44_39755 [Rhodococcus sp. SC4]|nr:hypothetical protein AXA44_39755 [Rhodococcus sp. SC4]